MIKFQMHTFKLKPIAQGVRRALWVLLGMATAFDASAQVSNEAAKQDPPPASNAQTKAAAVVLDKNGQVVHFPPKATSNLPYCSDIDLAESTKDLSGTTVARSDTLRGVMNDVITLKGRACVVRRDEGGDVRLQGDSVDYVYSSEDVSAVGNARLINRDGDEVTGDKINFNLATQTGRAAPAKFNIAKTEGRGSAESLDVLSSRRALMRDAYYTTCVGDNPDWYLKSSAMLIDQDKDIGEGISSVLVFKKIPILATPYIQFPLGKNRRSGFLTPSLGVSSSSGAEVVVPYYFNLAPNYDLTVYPGVLTNRGAKFGAEYRYMTKKLGSGSLYGNYVFSDKKYGNQDRYYWHVAHAKTWDLGRGTLTASIDAQKASDKNYTDDIPSDKQIDADSRILTSEYALQYKVDNWTARARVKTNQVLQNTSNSVAVPYDFKPQLTVAGSQRWGSLVASLDVESTNFTHPDDVNYASGWRHVMYPSLKYELRGASWFVTPKVGLHVTQYDLNRVPNGAVYDKKASRVMPIMSVDSGLVFERSGVKWLGESTIQTLEPRMYYLRVPYRNQNSIWNFDSALADFDLAHIYGENIFTGRDRIGEANQLTTGLTSRVLAEKTGEELFQATIAQRHYFSDQNVTLPNGTIDTNRKSDLLVSASGKVGKNVWIDTSAQYNFDNSQLMRADGSVRWQPAPRKVLNVGYSRNEVTSTPTSTVYASAQWPVKGVPNLYGVGRVNYDVKNHRISDAMVGWEYAKDCWVWSGLVKRSINTNGVYNNSYYIQLELKGLAGLGNNPTDQLKDNITGYQAARFIDEPVDAVTP